MGRTRGPTWSPTPEDYRRVFQEQNPWHKSGEVPDVWAKRVERPLAKFLPDRLKTDQPHRFQLILGPRRVGKTTSMYQTVRRLLKAGVPKESLWWWHLDHPLFMGISLENLCDYIIDASDCDVDRPVYLF